MTRTQQAEGNLALHEAFALYALKHPAVLDKIPQGANVVFIPGNDRDLASCNRRLLRSLQRQGEPVVVVHLKRPKVSSMRIEVLTPTKS